MKVNHIYQGDCIEIMREFDDKSIDFVFCDPPYNISQNKVIDRSHIQNRVLRCSGRKAKALNYNFGKWDKFESKDEFLEWTEQWLKECYRILGENGQIISFFPKSEISFLEAIMVGIGFHIRQELVWHKTNPVPQIFKVGYMSATEFMTWATKQKGAKHTFNYKLGQHHNVFTYPICQGNERTEHPTQKPLKLLEKIISYHSNKDDIILDCFAGSGSILVACKELNRRYIGIEILEEYCKIAENRLRQEMFDF